METSFGSRIIVKIVVDMDMCFLTLPCQHNIVIHYSDNTTEKRLVSATFIRKYKAILEPEEAKTHF